MGLAKAAAIWLVARGDTYLYGLRLTMPCLKVEFEVST